MYRLAPSKQFSLPYVMTVLLLQQSAAELIKLLLSKKKKSGLPGCGTMAQCHHPPRAESFCLMAMRLPSGQQATALLSSRQPPTSQQAIVTSHHARTCRLSRGRSGPTQGEPAAGRHASDSSTQPGAVVFPSLVWPGIVRSAGAGLVITERGLKMSAADGSRVLLLPCYASGACLVYNSSSRAKLKSVHGQIVAK